MIRTSDSAKPFQFYSISYSYFSIRTRLTVSEDLQEHIIIVDKVCDINPVPMHQVCDL